MSRTSVLPDVIDALIAQSTAALAAAGLTVSVTDGESIDADLGDYLMVGVEDPTQGVGVGAESEQKWALATPTQRDEEGGVWLAAFTTGETPKAARDRAFAIAGVVQGVLRTSKRLDVPGVLFTNYSSSKFSQWQTGYGPVALLLFRVGFRARI